MHQENIIKGKLWKKIGLSSKPSEVQRQIFKPSFQNLFVQEISDLSKSQSNQNKQFVLSKHSSMEKGSIKISLNNQEKVGSCFNKNINISTHRFETLAALGIQVADVYQSDSVNEQTQTQQKNPSQFRKYEDVFNQIVIKHQKGKEINMEYCQSDQRSPLSSYPISPFISSNINSDQKSLFNVLLKLKQCKNKIIQTNNQTRETFMLFKDFYSWFVHFLVQKNQYLEKNFILKKSSKSFGSASSYLKQNQNMMIIEEDQSYHSFQFNQKIEEMRDQLSDIQHFDKNPNHMDKSLKQQYFQQKQSKQNFNCADQLSIFQELVRKSLNNKSQGSQKFSIFLSRSHQGVVTKEDKIKILFEIIKQKDAQISDLRHLMSQNKDQYLQYKKMFGQTNNQLNQELDKMEAKLDAQESKYILLQQEFIKLKQIVDLRGSTCKQQKTINPNNSLIGVSAGESGLRLKILQLQCLNNQLGQNLKNGNEENIRLQKLVNEKNIMLALKNQQIASIKEEYQNTPTQLPIFRPVNLSSEKTVTRAFSFGIQGPLIINNLASSPKQTSKHNLQQLLKLKEDKLKEYELMIEEMSQKQKQMIKENNRLFKQIQKKSTKIQKIKDQTLEFQETKQKLNQILIARKQLSDSNLKLYEHIFDLQQRSTKVQNQYNQALEELNSIVKDEKIKYSQIQTNYKQLLNKINQINSHGNRSQNSHISSAAILNFHSATTIPDSQNATNQAKLYKQMYEKKQIQLLDLRNKYQNQTKAFVLDQQIEKQTDRFRIESFKEDIKFQEQVISKVKSQKQQLLKILKSQTIQLTDKSYLIEKLTLEVNKLKMIKQKTEQNNKNSKHRSQQIYSNIPQQIYPKEYQKFQPNNILNNQNSRIYQELQMRKQQLHRLELKIQGEQRMLQTTRRQIVTQYQQLMSIYSQIKSTKQEQISKRSYDHIFNLSKQPSKTQRTQLRQKWAHQQNQRTQNIFKSYCYLKSPSKERIRQSSSKKFLQVEKILNNLQSRQHLPTSDRQNNNFIVNPSQGRTDHANRIHIFQSENHIGLSRNSIKANSPKLTGILQKSLKKSPSSCRFEYTSPPLPSKRSSQNKKSQQKKLKLKMIQQKMRKLKAEVKDSLKNSC